MTGYDKERRVAAFSAFIAVSVAATILFRVYTDNILYRVYEANCLEDLYEKNNRFFEDNVGGPDGTSRVVQLRGSSDDGTGEMCDDREDIIQGGDEGGYSMLRVGGRGLVDSCLTACVYFGRGDTP